VIRAHPVKAKTGYAPAKVARCTRGRRSLEGLVARCWERVEERAFAGMSLGERRNLRRLLTKVRANLDSNVRRRSRGVFSV
jgi:hypothetical protein